MPAALDARLIHCHIALLSAIGLCGLEGDADGWFKVSRKKLMNYSKLKAIATYHKYLLDLVKLGYVFYVPSFDPFLGSRMKLVGS